MDAINNFFTWLFSTRPGVVCLLVGGIVICLIIAFILERRGKKMYYDHEVSEEDEGGLFSFGMTMTMMNSFARL